MIEFSLFILAAFFVVVVWVGRILSYPWAYKIGIPIDEVELPVEALEIMDQLDIRFFIIPKKGFNAIKEGYFWYPTNSKINKPFGLHYNRAYLLRVFGTIEKTIDGKAKLKTVAWSPVSFLFSIGTIAIFLHELNELTTVSNISDWSTEIFPFIFLGLVLVFCLKITYDESKIVSRIIATKFRFALNMI